MYALQACMEGIEVERLEEIVEKCDILVTTTGNKGIIMGNIGHFDGQLNMEGLEKAASNIKLCGREFVMTETPTTTLKVGCCMDDSYTNSMSNSRLTPAPCDRSSSCAFVDGNILDMCCCYGDADIAYFPPMTEYMDFEEVCPMTTETPSGCCRGYKSNDYDQAKCEAQGCEFEETDDFSECDITTTETPTTTSELGCCKADAKKRDDMCLSRDTEENVCDRRRARGSRGPEADCSFEETTTEEPGCCYINPDQAQSKNYQDTCITFGTERECLMLTDSDGKPRCVFESMNEYGDCSMLRTTTTETPTPASRCYGDSHKQNDRGAKTTTKSRCENGLLLPRDR